MIYDGATGCSRGTSREGTVAVVADLAAGAPMGFLVLCDLGPGPDSEAAAARAGHCGVIVTELFSELKFQGADPEVLERDFAVIVRSAAENAAVGAGGRAGSLAERLASGGALMVVALFANRLRWIAAGGAALLHARRGEVRRLDPPAGGSPREEGLRDSAGAILLKPGDTLMALSRPASEAEERRVRDALARSHGRPAGEIVSGLLEALAGAPPAPALAFGVARLR